MNPEGGRLLRMLSRRQYRKNPKVYILQTLVVALTVFIVNGCFYGIRGIVEVAQEPLRRWAGGRTAILRSREEPGFEYLTSGIVATWSWGLFTPDDIADLPQISCLMLNLPVMVSTGTASDSRWRILGRTSFSSGSVPESVFDRLEPNQVILNAQEPETRERMTPGSLIRAFVPKVAPGKGSPNFIGVPRLREGIDYVDFGNGQWVDLTVVAVTNEMLYPDALICDLEWLQEVSGGHDYVNWAASNSAPNEPALAKMAEDGEWQVFESSRILYGVTAELSAIEQSGHYLWLAVLCVAAVMSLTTAAYVVSTDAKDIILLQVLGVGKTQAAAVVALPLAISAFAGALAGATLSRLILFPILRTVSFSIADLSAFVLAPGAFMGLAAFFRAVSSIKRLPELEVLDDYE